MKLYSLPLLLLLWIPLTVSAVSNPVELPSGTEVSVYRFGSGDVRLLWLPAEYGMRGPVERELAAAIADEAGAEVWLADLHETYFLPPGRSSLEKVERSEIVELIEAALPEQGKLILFSYGRGAALALEAVRQWQLEHPDNEALGGAVFLHPTLTAGVAEAGEEPRYRPIASATNLPLYIMQPENSAKRWYLEGLVERLRRGGSDVFTESLAGVSDGYQVRPDATEGELVERKKLPARVARALKALSIYQKGTREAVAQLPPPESDADMSRSANLQPLPQPTPAPQLALTAVDGKRYNLDDYRGKVVLLNFWATWCPPCVEEIPSLGRLQQRLGGEGLVVLSVDVGQSKAEVEEFLKEVPAQFPVMLDPEGSVVKPWKVRAFPTSYLIDREGLMRYGYFGALEWDSPEVVSVIGKVLQE